MCKLRGVISAITRHLLDNQRFLFIIRILLGGTFIISAVFKLPHQSEFVQIVISYGVLPYSLAEFYAIALPWLELIIGWMLVLGVLTRLSSLISLLMIVSFIVAGSFALLGISAGNGDLCGCFGEALPMSHVQSLTIDAIMLVMALILMMRSSRLMRLKLSLNKIAVARLASIVLLIFMFATMFTPSAFQASIAKSQEPDSPMLAHKDVDMTVRLGGDKPVLWFLYAEWCSHCKEQKPVIDELAMEYVDEIAFTYLNIQDNPDAVTKWSIQTIPTIILTESKDADAEYLRLEGKTEKETIKAGLDALLNGRTLESASASYEVESNTPATIEDVSAGEPASAGIDREIDISLINGTPVFLFFYAEWCHYCQEQHPVIDELEEEYGESITFIRAESSEYAEDLVEWGVTGFPSMLLIVGRENDAYIYQEFGGFTDKDILARSFDYLLENGSLPEDAIQSGYVHHSCSTLKCYENCIADEFKYPDGVAIERFATDVVLDCLTGKVSDALQVSQQWRNAYQASKAGECAYICDIAGVSITPGAPATGGGSARQMGDCAQCAIENTIGLLPVAGCVIDLWNFLGDLLEPHADCLAECSAPSSTWKTNRGHPCRDHQDYMSKCQGNFLEEYECVDCGWQIRDLVHCDEGCEMTPSGAVCKGRCKEEKCDDFNDCTIDYCLKGECYHERSSDPGCGCEDCDDGNSCTTDYCDDNGSCQHMNKPGCCPPSCDDGDRCTRDWCDGNGSCSHARVPGCDHPDDNQDYSTAPGFHVVAVDDDSSLAVLSNGFADYTLRALVRTGRNAALVELSLQGVGDYSMLVIPSGGLAGLETSESFKSRLWSWVESGGTLIAFAQQRGDEFEALPGGEVTGYGWAEDQSCHFRSVGLTRYHPILSGQTVEEPSFNVDGFFTSHSENASVLLTRIKNGKPAMILYEYGAGRVLASTLYTDMSGSLYQQGENELMFMRDILAWAEAQTDIVTYAPGDLELAIPVSNPLSGASGDTVPEFNAGDMVTLTVDVENTGDLTADTVTLMLYDPGYNLADSVNVTSTIPANETRQVTLNYQTSADAETGIWKILYLLYSGDEPVAADFGGEFTLGYNMASHSQFQGYVTVTTPGEDIVLDTTQPVEIPPGEAGSLDVAFTANDYGIWSARYSIMSSDNSVLMSSSYPFAVSDWAENPEGWAYHGDEINFSITSATEGYIAGSTASFTIHLWNHTDTERTVTCWFSFIWNYRKTQDNIYGSPGTTQPGHSSNLFQTLSIPAQGYNSFDYSVPIYFLDRLWADFYEGDETSYDYLGKASRGIYPITPRVEVGLSTNRLSYAQGENIPVTLTLTNFIDAVYDIDTTVSLVDMNGTVLAEEHFTDTLPPFPATEHTLSLQIPADAPLGSSYQLVAQGYCGGALAGGSSALIDVSYQYSASLYLDSPDLRYKAGETVQIDLTMHNASSSSWEGDVQLDVPVANFVEMAHFSLDSNSNETRTFFATLPSDATAGEHNVLLSVPADTYTLERSFIIPASELSLELAGLAYNVGETLAAELTNTGGAGTTGECSIVLIRTDAEMSATVAIQPDETVELSLPIPISVPSGSYDVLILCKNLTTEHVVLLNENIEIHGSELELAIGETTYNAGDTLNINLTNTGVEDTTADCSITMHDLLNYSFQESSVHSIPAGNTVDLTFEIPATVATGTYRLLAQCTDVNNSTVARLYTNITVNGVDASLTSVTDKKIYLNNQDIQIQTHVANSDQDLTGGLLNLRIWSTSAAEVTDVTEEWVAKYVGYEDKNDTISDMAMDNLGHIYVTGTGDSGSYSTQYATAMFDADGTQIWSKRYGSTESGYYSEANGIAVDYMGNAYVTGKSGSYESEYDCVTIKYDALGTEQWVKRYDNINESKSYNFGVDIAVDESGNVVVTGYGYGETGSYDYITIKYDSDGNELWARYYDGPDITSDKPKEVVVDTAGNIYVTGTSSGDYATVKYDADGNEVWVALYDGIMNNADVPEAMAVDDSGNVYVTGGSTAPKIDNPDWEQLDFATVKYDVDGNEEWVACYDGPISFHDTAFDIGVDAYGNVYVTGSTSVALEGEFLDEDFATIKYDADGNQVWIDIYGHLEGWREIPTGLALDSHGNVYVTGYIAYADMLTVKYDGVSGGKQWLITYNGADFEDRATAIAVEGENNIYVAGSSYSWGTTRMHDDFTIIKYTQEVSGTSPWEWETDIPLSLNANEIWDENTPVNNPGITGKLYHNARLYNSADQLIEESEPYTFYITDSDFSLTLETDKVFYRPGGTVNISGELHNAAAASDDVTLTVSMNDVVIYTDSFTLEPGETQAYSTTATAASTFVLEASAGGVTVTDQIEVVPYGVKLDINAPDVVGLEPFDAVLIIENESDGDYTIDVSFADSTWDGLELPAGTIELLDTTLSITEDSILEASLTGDVILTETKLVRMGEMAALQVIPAESYSPGTVEIPFSVNNAGLIDIEFEATFTIDGQTINRTLYVPAGTTLDGTLALELASGTYNLDYDSPHGSGTVTISVTGGPEFEVTSLPENLDLMAGDPTWNFTVKNAGGSGGFVEFYLALPDWEDSQVAWLESGEETVFSFDFAVPDDLEENDYTAYFEINGEQYSVVFSVQGPKVAVDASLDKNLYVQGDTAALTLDVRNISAFDLDLFARVQLGDYEAIEEFSLSANTSTSGTDITLPFDVPVDFDSGKLFFGIYMTSGRALHLNALYVYERYSLGLWTDQQVYNIGDMVTVYMEAPFAGTVDITAPDYADQIALSAGLSTTSFTLPALITGTYYIEYEFNDDSARYPFDVRGYSGRITEFSLDKGSYQPGDTINITAIAEVNPAADGVMSCRVLDHWGSTVSEFETSVNLVEGKNTLQAGTDFNGNSAGLYSVQCQLSAEVSGQTLMLASAQQYFDVAGINAAPLPDAGAAYFATEGATVIFDGGNSYDLNNEALQYRWDFDSDGTWDTEWSAEVTASHAWADDWRGTATMQATDGEASATDTVMVDIDNSPPAVAAGHDQSVSAGVTVYFSGSFTDYGVLDTHTIVWDFGDGFTESGTLETTHSYASSGTYTVSLTVTDDDGGKGSDTMKITVSGGDSDGSTNGGTGIGTADTGEGEEDIDEDVKESPAQASPDDFTVSSMIITSGEVQIGETIVISVVVTNTSDFVGSYVLDLELDGMVVQTKEVTLGAGQSQTVSFNLVTGDAGIHIVKIGDMSLMFEVLALEEMAEHGLPPPEFVITNLSVNPQELRPAEEVTISVMVTNTGGSDGSYSITLKVNDMEEARREVVLGVGDSERVTFTLAKSELGSYLVDVNGKVGQFRVVLLPPMAEPTGTLPFQPSTQWWLFGPIIAGVVIIGLLAYFLWWRRRFSA
jgi:thiol-disulfide isomerase/thioredoxin/PKD repeat protein